MSPPRLHLRAARLDDADAVADLETARTPDDPRDGVMVAFAWTHEPGHENALRLIDVRDGEAVAYVGAGHVPWGTATHRFGFHRVRLHPRIFAGELFAEGVGVAERWLAADGAEAFVTRTREDFTDELSTLSDLGYGEARREKFWELDLLAHRDELLRGAESARAAMRTQGIELLTLDRDRDPDVLKKVYDLDMETTAHVPTTVPFHIPDFDEWSKGYFDNPGIHRDRFWIARDGAEVVGLSLIEFPPGRGIPSTEYTGTSPRHRGRGIARALKYETVAQAIALGATRIRTDNDSENAPILHLNEVMGYLPAKAFVELHRTATTR